MPFDEIVANPSDLKHVGELMGCSDGLGMVITTRMHRWDAFEGLSGAGPSRCDRTKQENKNDTLLFILLDQVDTRFFGPNTSFGHRVIYIFFREALEWCRNFCTARADDFITAAV